MLNRFAKITFAASLLAGALATGCTVTTSTDDTTLTVVNNESFEITNIWIGPSDGTFVQTDDILGGIPLAVGDSITVSVECDSYDIEVADPTADCDVGNFSLCGGDNELDIDDAFFDECVSGRKTPGVSQVSPSNTASTSLR